MTGQPTDEELTALTGITAKESLHFERVAAAEAHSRAARDAADILLGRIRTLARNGADLRNPLLRAELLRAEIQSAVDNAGVDACECRGRQGPAVYAMLAELACRAAEPGR